MQITIDVKDSAIDKIMYFLNHLKSDVKIIEKTDTNSLKIEALSKNEDDYKHILNGRKERKESTENYGTLDDIK
ncbi:hypothetical protein [Sulfurimonas sp.]|uniref:hypothetical protein n=1 Tax=Sulfurimonas sp. TaxID=2022749 RepID=UPI00286E5AC2|nr:hypothetical protein [Sulfurimonas sp.]